MAVLDGGGLGWGRFSSGSLSKLWVKSQPFLASNAVIFSVDFTGTHILVVKRGPVNFFFQLVLPFLV